jgi:hypothetical protein
MLFRNRSRCSGRDADPMSVCSPCNRCGSHAARVWDKKSALFLVIALQRHAGPQ